MAKFEETGAAVGAMLPVTPVSEVLTKAPTVESVDNEYAALKLTNTDDSNNNVELPDNIPPADDPMNPGFANPEEAPATPEEIEEVNIYIKPEESAVFYVVNNKIQGQIPF